MLILVRGSMLNLPNFVFSLWMEKYINKRNNIKDLFAFVHKPVWSGSQQAFLFCSTNHTKKKMLIFARESMSNLPNSSISLWTAKNIFDFVCKSHFPQLNLVRTLPNLSFLFLWNIEKMLILVRESMLNLPSSSISLWMTKYINKINNRKDLFNFVHNPA